MTYITIFRFFDSRIFHGVHQTSSITYHVSNHDIILTIDITVFHIVIFIHWVKVDLGATLGNACL